MENKINLRAECYDSGAVYITNDGEIKASLLISDDDVTIEVGSHSLPTIIEKLYGPLVMFPLRISMDAITCEWVVERQQGKDHSWKECIRIPGQLEEDFEC